MHILSLLGYLFLLTTSGVLLVALLRAQRTTRDLAQQLALAREQHHQHTLQLTHRSELDTVKDELISTVPDELRTPLTSIRGALGLLSSGIIGDVDAKALNLLRIAGTNPDRLIRLINDILDLERMESGRAPLQIRRCSLRELAQQAIESMSGMADASTVHLELAPLTPAHSAAIEALFFDGDSDPLLHVLPNPPSNALKFSPSASTVRIFTEATADSILFKVSDEARGIPADQLDTIFHPFHHLEPSPPPPNSPPGL